jgi:hypothetical protein
MDGAGEALGEGVLDAVGVVDAPLLRDAAGVPVTEGVAEGSDDEDLVSLGVDDMVRLDV